MRGWTTWAAYAEFREHEIGTIVGSRRANLTVVDIDPFQTAEKEPPSCSTGGSCMTIVGGKIVFQK